LPLTQARCWCRRRSNSTAFMDLPPDWRPAGRSSSFGSFAFAIRWRWAVHGHSTDRSPANPPQPGRVSSLMDTNLLDAKFARIGARLKVADRPSLRSRTSGVVSLDVRADRTGEFFEIVRPPGAEVAVLDVQPAGRRRAGPGRVGPGEVGLPRSRWVKRLGQEGQVVEYFKPRERPEWMAAQGHAALPNSVLVRGLRFRVPIPGRRARGVTVVPTGVRGRRRQIRPRSWAIARRVGSGRESATFALRRARALGILARDGLLVMKESQQPHHARRPSPVPGQQKFKPYNGLRLLTAFMNVPFFPPR
jgi:hypothetical protein